MKALDWLSDILKKGGSFFLVGMMALTCADVIGRMFGYPILGAVELVMAMTTLAIGMGLPFTHRSRGHVGVEILIRLFSARTQTIIELCTSTLSFLLFAIVTWRMFVYARTLQNTGEETVNLALPLFIFIYALSFCLIIFTLTIFRDILANIQKLRAR
ncbi:MAG: TRAP transporter small permease [Deltaproteobacteria bacterium]|jgi:TRAP-type C4-dicarboxylate transport system permease small subunit|nr:TRAP transporter small permease [Deltaproteobacteria bacterium]HEJ84122.1 TRAP transporter small permease [Desulfobacteraceae bacterium]